MEFKNLKLKVEDGMELEVEVRTPSFLSGYWSFRFHPILLKVKAHVISTLI